MASALNYCLYSLRKSMIDKHITQHMLDHPNMFNLENEMSAKQDRLDWRNTRFSVRGSCLLELEL